MYKILKLTNIFNYNDDIFYKIDKYKVLLLFKYNILFVDNLINHLK